MEKELSLAKIGTTVDINIERINETISTDLKEQLKESPYGKVVGYKITDGVELGVILKLNNGDNFWFFEREISSSNVDLNSNKYIINKRISARSNFNYSSNINEVLNPLNFIKWLRLSLDNIT